MKVAEGSARVRLQEEQPTIDRLGKAFTDLLRCAVAEQRHGRVAMSVNISAGHLTVATPTTEFTVKL